MSRALQMVGTTFLHTPPSAAAGHPDDGSREGSKSGCEKPVATTGGSGELTECPGPRGPLFWPTLPGSASGLPARSLKPESYLPGPAGPIVGQSVSGSTTTPARLLKPEDYLPGPAGPIVGKLVSRSTTPPAHLLKPEDYLPRGAKPIVGPLACFRKPEPGTAGYLPSPGKQLGLDTGHDGAGKRPSDEDSNDSNKRPRIESFDEDVQPDMPAELSISNILVIIDTDESF